MTTRPSSIDPTVCLADGRVVSRNSVEWLVECDALFVLRKHHAHRPACMLLRQEKRSADAVAALEAKMHEIEPAYVLDYLPNYTQRHAYVAEVRQYRGDNPADHLAARIRALIAARAAALPAAA